MKRLATPIFVFAILFIALSISTLQAQNIDQSLMNQDLAIMKGVLNELFKLTWNNINRSKGTAPDSHSIINWNRPGEITATYIPGYGVLFTINRNPVIFYTNLNGRPMFIHSDSNNKSKTALTKHSVIDRIKEFLEDYAPSIHQLKSNERITVVLNSNQESSHKAKLPSVAVSAKMMDLKAYRKDDLNKKGLTSKLSITNLNKPAQGDQHLKIFAGILESAFSDQKADNFKLRNIHYFRLKGTGVLFEGEASNGWRFLSGINMTVWPVKWGKLSNRLYHLDSTKVNSKVYKVKSAKIKALQNRIDSMQQKKNQNKQKLRDILDHFISTLKQTLLDYGNTLRSLKPDESIIISISISGTGDDLPGHLCLQVKKSTLQAYNKGAINRSQALNKIRIIKH
jgi:hypothetical protein